MSHGRKTIIIFSQAKRNLESFAQAINEAGHGSKQGRRTMSSTKGNTGRYAHLAIMSGLVILLAVSMIYSLQKPVHIQVDGKIIKDRVFFTSTIDQVLEANDIAMGSKDRVEPALNSVVKKDATITVIRAAVVKVVADGETHEVLTPPVGIHEAIALAGVQVGEKDIIKTIAVNTTIPNQVIEVIRVTNEEIRVETPIPYMTENTADNTLEKGLTRTLRPGQNGVARDTVQITYNNGVEVERKVINSETISQPINAVVAVGNITSISRGGLNINFSKAMVVHTSAYTYTGRNTATGLKPAVGLVAVDPSVIPLGTRLYIEGYGYATAADTGGAIKGSRIDVFMEDRSQCLSWGRRTVKVYLLD